MRPPLPGVWSEYGIGLAIIFYHFLFGENDLILVRMEFNAIFLKPIGHLLIALTGIGLIILVGVNRTDRVLLTDFLDDGQGFPIPNIEGGTTFDQYFLDLFEGLMDELNPPVFFILQLLQDLRIKNENWLHRQSAAQGRKKSGVILQPQVASKPKQSHGSRHIRKTSLGKNGS